MTDKWPSLYDQVSAALAAPIPFFVVVAIIAWAAWRAWRWRFKAVLEKQTELYTLSREEVAYWKDLAQRTANELTQQIVVLKKEKDINAETQIKLDGLTARLSRELDRLGQANSSTAAFPIVGTLAPLSHGQQMD
jgi:hypothetical protein